MAKRQKEHARKTRVFFVDLLGGKCAHCGAIENLEFDCIVPQGHAHHVKDPSAKMSFYRFQLRAMNLQILCKSCNSKKGNGPDKILQPLEWLKYKANPDKWLAENEEPF